MSTKRSFDCVANWARKKRLEKGYSQSELAAKLNYKNGQFISNVERAKCHYPLWILSHFSDVMQLSKEEIQEMKDAILADYEITIENVISKGKKGASNGKEPRNERSDVANGPQNPTRTISRIGE